MRIGKNNQEIWQLLSRMNRGKKYEYAFWQ